VAGVTPRVHRLARIGVGLAVVAATVVAVGAGPFLRGLEAVSPAAILLAALLTATATVAAAWRWRAIAGGLGLRLGWGAAIAAYYRSQFLNAVLPGGVVGDVHRAYDHGRRTGEPGLGARAVVAERVAGQVVQLVLVVVALTALGLTAPLGAAAWAAAAVGAVILVALVIVAFTARGRRMLRREGTLLRGVFADPRRTVSVVISSVVVIACHTTTFVVATLASGVHAPLGDLVALALVALTAASLPINVGGWGPREAAAGSAFALVGLSAGAGVAASTAFGVLALVAALPGALVLVVERVALVRSRRVIPVPSTVETPA
jgi:uncharacterized membrane protein YbhN (UPF0104 family)